MKNIYTILALTLIVSCYTKKNCVEKFCSKDTLVVTLHDTIRTETIKHDTAFVYKGDTITITKDRLQIKYYRVNDTTYIEGTCINGFGSVQINATGGTSPYTFDWYYPNLGYGDFKTGLSAGTYLVRANDSTLPVNNQFYINVIVPSGLSVDITSIVNAISFLSVSFLPLLCKGFV